MGGGSSETNTKKTTKRETKIRDTRAAVSDQGVAATGDGNTVKVERLGAELVQEALDSGETALLETLDFAEGTQEGLEKSVNQAVEVASQEATSEVKDVAQQYGKWGALAGTAIALALIFRG